MIRIDGIDNQFWEITIEGYEFPEDGKGEWDSSWVKIHFKIDTKIGKEEISDPCLTTGEFKKIINWLNSLSDNKDIGNTLSFTEPFLSIESGKRNDKVMLRFIYNLSDDTKYSIDCELTRSEIKKLAGDFERELSKFPER